jgi:cell division protein FtsI/penicillin-binding protein 2
VRKPNKKRSASVKAKLRANVAFRMNILFFSIFLLFTILILRLGYLQIVEGEDYKRALERTEEVPVNSSVPRGRIYDSEGRILVDNEPKNAITYTKMQTTKSSEMLDIAKKIAKLIDKSIEDITLRDQQDFWILNNTEDAYKKVSKKEQDEILSNEDLSTSQQQKKLDKLVRDRITPKELNSFSDEELEVLAIFH